MKNEIDFDAIENATGKISIGFRGDPEEKLALVTEAENLGLSLSGYLRSMVAKRHKVAHGNNQQEIERYKEIISERDTLIGDLRQKVDLKNEECQSLANELIKERGEKKQLQIEITAIKNNTVKNTSDNSIYNHPMLLNLFQFLKGKSDEIETSDGKVYRTTYTTSRDLLEAMIYSFKLKKK